MGGEERKDIIHLIYNVERLINVTIDISYLTRRHKENNDDNDDRNVRNIAPCIPFNRVKKISLLRLSYHMIVINCSIQMVIIVPRFPLFFSSYLYFAILYIEFDIMM